MTAPVPVSLTCQIVGAWARPPAQVILLALRSGTRLELVPEPENPYDEKAIRVFVDSAHIPEVSRPGLAEALPDCGWALDEILARGTGNAPGGQAWVFLGYIPDSDGKVIARTGGPGNREVGKAMAAGPVEAELAFGADGKPLVTVEPGK